MTSTVPLPRIELVPTPAAWGPAVASEPAALLVDQAHLEKKAASAGMGFLFRVGLEPRWQRGLSNLVREELVHFERVLRLCQTRGIVFAPQVPSDYMARLKRGARVDMPGRLIDELLLAALIEARSSERMRAVAAAVAPTDPELAAFYLDLVEAEDRHEAFYVELATALAKEPIAVRLAELSAHEGAVLAALPRGPRLHSGHEAPGDGG